MATTLLLLSVLLQPAPSGFSAAVMNVSDGDTLTVLRADHVRVKIRIHGVDAPELGQDCGRRAKEFATELAAGKPVAILPRDTDRYGRNRGRGPVAGRPLARGGDDPRRDGVASRQVCAGR